MSNKIKCTFCGGRGKDPFDLLSTIAECLVCNGSGMVEIEEPLKKCLFCLGTGKNPLGARVSCIVCSGKGYVSYGNLPQCIQCKGTGKSVDGLPCSICGGRGCK